MIIALLRPFLGWIAGGAIIAALLGGFFLKIRHQGVLAERARIEQENSDAIEKATRARDAARAACDRSPADCVPNDQFRD